MIKILIMIYKYLLRNIVKKKKFKYSNEFDDVIKYTYCVDNLYKKYDNIT